MNRAGLRTLVACLLVGGPVQAQRGRPAPTPSPFTAALAAATPDILAAVSTFLSDSLVAGRVPGTRGGDLSARFLAAQFQALGLAPGAGDSYLQAVPLLSLRTRASVVLGAGRETFSPKSPDEAVLWPLTTDPVVSMDGEMVFAGYGIEAPEFGWDDYKGVPQTGRIVLLLAGDAGMQDSTAYGGKKQPRYGNLDYKLELAARMGAAGVILVHSSAGAGPWSRTVAPMAREQLWLDGRQPAPGLKFAGWIREELARRLLTTAGRDYQLLLRRARAREFNPVATGVHASIDMDTEVSRTQGLNVVARLEGTDSTARREPMIIAAPYVRLGSEAAFWTDSVSAVGDDVAGVATLVTVAAGAARFMPPRRPIVFVATAGRPGTERFIQAELHAGVIQIEGTPAGASETAGLALDRSTLGEMAKAAAQAENLVLVGADSDAELAASGVATFAGTMAPVIALRPTSSPKAARLALRIAWSVATSTQVPSWFQGMEPKTPQARPKPR